MSEMENDVAGPVEHLLAEARGMTGQELRTLGLSQIAYCRTVIQDGASMVTIHAADGTPVAVVEDEESALDAILEYEMMPAFLQ